MRLIATVVYLAGGKNGNTVQARLSSKHLLRAKQVLPLSNLQTPFSCSLGHAAELDLQQVDGFEVLEGVFPDALDLVGVEEEKLE